MADRRFVVQPGWTKADAIVEVFDHVTAETLMIWSCLLPAAETEWPA